MESTKIDSYYGAILYDSKRALQILVKILEEENTLNKKKE